MKYLLFLLYLIGCYSCLHKQPNASVEKEFGAKIDTTYAITVSDLNNNMLGKKELECTVIGKITDVCQSAGCWLNLENPNGSPIMVRMKDHDFFVPKDIAGRMVYLQGLAFVDTTSVEMLQHYAEDAGKSKEEILAITEPKTEVVIEAKGVVLLNKDEPGQK
jgi:hypothetical protein